MPAIIVVGAQWGDEGKGKVVDVLAENADAVVRYQGGNNAGHTIVNEHGEFVLHSIPAGILHGKPSIMSWGMATDPISLVIEMNELEQRGADLKNLKINPFVHLVMPWQILKDRAKEKSAKTERIGTTGRGIGPCYQDKMGRSEAIRMADLLDRNHFLTKFERVYMTKSSKLSHYPEFPGLEEIREKYLEARERIAPYITDTQKIVEDFLWQRKTVLLEGAQGQRLCIDTGTYPYVTSSNTTSSAALMYSGVPPREIISIIGVIKPYDTRVGLGPIPTELGGKISEEWCNDPDNNRTLEEKVFPDVSLSDADEFLQGVALRRLGNEYGATTGRPRRCGFLDLPLLRYSNRFIHATEFALTKLDVFTLAEQIKVSTAYRGVGPDIGVFEFLNLRNQVPEFAEDIESWGDLSGVKKYKDLPETAQNFVKKIECFVGRPITFISTGAKRHQYVR